MEETLLVQDEISANYSYAEKLKKGDMTSGFAWDDREQLFYGMYKGPDEKTKSTYSTGELQSLVLDSACRVMGQMASGRFSALDNENLSKVIAANLVFHEYILPNANTGGSFFTKQRQANIYSKVYGKMPAFIDYVVSEKYTGPDLVLIHPRRFMPQPGKCSIKDMDWCFVDTLVTKEWLEARSKTNPEIWNPAIIADLNDSTVDQSLLSDQEKKGSAERKNIVLRNYFTREGDWTMYEASSKKVIFSEKNYWPGIPMVEKGCIPVLDRYWDLCDYERGETPQKNIDTLSRKYLEAVDKSIDPTTILDPENMVMSSVGKDNKYWFAKEGKTNEPRVLETSPQGLATFPVTYNIMKANLMSMSAQSDTSISAGTDSRFGKTPEALKMQGAREGARDSWDRYMQERFFEDCADMMMAVASKRGMGEIRIPGIESALEKIKKAYPEQEINIFRSGVINGNLLSEFGARYKVDEGSTAKKDDAGESTMAFLERIAKNPEIITALTAEGKKINWGAAIKRVAIDNAIQDWDEILVTVEKPDSIENVGDNGGTIVEEQPQQVMPGQPQMPLVPAQRKSQPTNVY